jgi:hypothetical protein
MTGRPLGARRWQRRAVAWIAATIAGVGASAQSVGEGPQAVGFAAGPFVIAPSLTAGYAYDSNVFLQSEELHPPPDQVLTLEPRVQLTLPFSNSSLRVRDALSYVDYKETPQTAGKTSNDAEAELILNFGSLDALKLYARHLAGVAQTLAFDPGGEVIFQGNAFRLHNEAASVAREIEGARGYRFSLARNVLKFDPSTEVEFFDYRGFDGEGAYLQPVSANTRLAFGYVGNRYDHFDITPGADPTAVFRTESGNAVYAQVEGRLGPKQPYSARLGWEHLAFTGNEAKDFSGLIGQAKLAAIVGGGTILAVSAVRQPYRSFFFQNNFYVYEQIGGEVDRPFQGGTAVGGELSFSRSSYPEANPAQSAAPGTFRQDRAIRLEAYANLAIRERVLFRLSFLKTRKYANYPGADYNDTVVFGGFVLGWI